MNTYTVYTARLQYKDNNKKKGEIKAHNVEQVIETIKKPINDGGFNLNPFYAVIVDESNGAKIILHNKHLQFVPEPAE